MFCAFCTQKIFWKPKPAGLEAEPRSSRRARDKHRASDRR